MKFEEIERIEEMKRQIAQEQNGLCATCGDPLGPVFDLAHRIPKHGWMVKKYGPKVIHHRINLRATHSGRCNDAVMVSPASRPVEAQKIIDEIMEDLKYGKM